MHDKLLDWDFMQLLFRVNCELVEFISCLISHIRQFFQVFFYFIVQ